NSVSTICAVRNSFNTVNVAYDAAHLLNQATGGTGAGIAVSANDPSNPIYPGTQLGFLEEHTVGFETQLPKKFVLSARYIDRNMKRIVEDAAVVSPEAANGGLFGQAYFLANVSSTFDGAINPVPHVFTPTFNSSGVITNWPTACGPVTNGSPMWGTEVDDP